MSEILLIEDNPADIVLTKEAFKECRYKHNITAFKDGIEALKYLKREGEYSNSKTPDLVLLDLNLPKKDGRELLAEIKSDDSINFIPVIVLSTSRNETDIKTSYDLKANCYICKPVELESFINIILSIERFWLKTVTLPDYEKII
jgi:chemotaxis family two-component system response regulator Rcp1